MIIRFNKNGLRIIFLFLMLSFFDAAMAITFSKRGIKYYVIDEFRVGVSGCDKSFTTLDIPEKVSSPWGDVFEVVEVSRLAFASHHNIQRIKLPNTITVIGSRAFEYSEKLEWVVLPEKLKSMGESEFDRCDSLKGIICLNPLPTSAPYLCFGYFPRTLYVPLESVEKYYQSRSYNPEKKNRIKAIDELPPSIKEWAFN